jgi:hypothetical protein
MDEAEKRALEAIRMELDSELLADDAALNEHYRHYDKKYVVKHLATSPRFVFSGAGLLRYRQGQASRPVDAAQGLIREGIAHISLETVYNSLGGCWARDGQELVSIDQTMRRPPASPAVWAAGAAPIGRVSISGEDGDFELPLSAGTALVMGPANVGKTTLAVELARRLAAPTLLVKQNESLDPFSTYPQNVTATTPLRTLPSVCEVMDGFVASVVREYVLKHGPWVVLDGGRYELRGAGPSMVIITDSITESAEDAALGRSTEERGFQISLTRLPLGKDICAQDVFPYAGRITYIDILNTRRFAKTLDENTELTQTVEGRIPIVLSLFSRDQGGIVGAIGARGLRGSRGKSRPPKFTLKEGRGLQASKPEDRRY